MYSQLIQTSINLLENKLNEPIHIEDIATTLHLSKYHFSRVFKAAVGLPPLEYIRKRRLHLSAKELLTSSKSTIDLAEEFAFDSRESFSRAFKKEFNLSPTHFRKENPYFTFFEKCTLNHCHFNLLNKNGNVDLFVDILLLDKFTLFGYQELIKMPDYTTIPKLLKKLETHFLGPAKPFELWGVHFNHNFSKEGFSFDYFIGCFEKNILPPRSFQTYKVKEHLFAHFIHIGSIYDKKGELLLRYTHDYIYEKWLPNSPYELADNFNLEYYSTKFIENGFHGELHLYIPIKLKRT